MFGPTVVGLSLASRAVMRFRRDLAGGGKEQFILDLAPRSLYILSGEARSDWQHSLNPTTSLRYSITFRTVREKQNGDVLAAEEAEIVPSLQERAVEWPRQLTLPVVQHLSRQSYRKEEQA